MIDKDKILSIAEFLNDCYDESILLDDVDFSKIVDDRLNELPVKEQKEFKEALNWDTPTESNCNCDGGCGDCKCGNKM